MKPPGPFQQFEDELAKGFDVVFAIGTSALFPYIARPVDGTRWRQWLVEDQRFVHNRPDVLGRIAGLLTALGESVRTDIATREIESFLSLGKKVDSQNISTTVVDAWKKESLLRVDHIDTPSGAAFVLVPRSGTWEEVRDLAGNLLHLSAKQDREERIRTENARILIASNQNRAKNARVLQTFLEESLHIASVRTTILPKNQVEEKSFIAEKENLATPYALDALLKALPIEKQPGMSISLTTRDPYDILIVVGEDFKVGTLEAPIEDDTTRDTRDDSDTVLDPSPYSGIRM